MAKTMSGRSSPQLGQKQVMQAEVFGNPNFVIIKDHHSINTGTQKYMESHNNYERNNVKVVHRKKTMETQNEFAKTIIGKMELDKTKASMYNKIRVLKKSNQLCKASSYTSKVKKANILAYQETLNGIGNLNDICHLQIRGKNQFRKEVKELEGIQHKHIDHQALFRNEMTQEVEGEKKKTKKEPIFPVKT